MELRERSQNEVLTESVLSYIRDHREKNKKTPSIAHLIEKIEGLNRRSFYSLFPGGISEPCALLGIPAPKERIEATKIARQGKLEVPRVDDGSINAIMRLLGESNPQEAIRKTVKIVADYTSFAMLYGLKDARELVEHFEKIRDLDTDRIIALSLENQDLIDDYYFENDSELMDVLEVPQYIRMRFDSFKRRFPVRGASFLDWLYANFIEFCREARRSDYEASRYFA